ncbi:MAG: PilZ domain-containing protein [Nitrospirota bacterium]
MNEIRSHIRYELEKEIEYCIDEENTKEIFKGVITNISSAGACLFIFKPLQKEQKIIVKIKTGIRELKWKADVRWCNELGENIYKVGLVFV